MAQIFLSHSAKNTKGLDFLYELLCVPVISDVRFRAKEGFVRQ